MQYKDKDFLDAIRYICSNINDLGVFTKDEPVYKHTKKWTSEKDWPERDSIPTSDPIGDIDSSDSEWIEGYLGWKKDMENYEKYMKSRRIPLKNKENTDTYKKQEIKCTCGTEKVYGKVPIKAHSNMCDLRKDIEKC